MEVVKWLHEMPKPTLAVIPGAAAGAGLDSAGHTLLFHAAAVIAAASALAQGLLFRPLAIAAAIGLVVGAALFSGDIAMRAFAGHRLFPFAAPAGGVILIVSWIAVALAAVDALGRG